MSAGGALAIMWVFFVAVAVVRHMWVNPPELLPLAKLTPDQYRAVMVLPYLEGK